MLYITGQVDTPFEGDTEMVGKDEYEQSKQIFSRIDRIIKAAGQFSEDDDLGRRHQEQSRGLASAPRVFKGDLHFHAC